MISDPLLLFHISDLHFGLEDRAALAWCKACPVTDECLQAQLAVEPHGRDMRHGIFGATTPLDRYRTWLDERARAAA